VTSSSPAAYGESATTTSNGGPPPGRQCVRSSDHFEDIGSDTASGSGSRTGAVSRGEMRPDPAIPDRPCFQPVEMPLADGDDGGLAQFGMKSSALGLDCRAVHGDSCTTSASSDPYVVVGGSARRSAHSPSPTEAVAFWFGW
jgi:hypothetical protein